MVKQNLLKSIEFHIVFLKKSSNTYTTTVKSRVLTCVNNMEIIFSPKGHSKFKHKFPLHRQSEKASILNLLLNPDFLYKTLKVFNL